MITYTPNQKAEVLQRVRAARGIVLALLCAMISGCLGIPDNTTAVQNFELERYLGTWYEIARLDHRFERGLSRVQAQYSLREDDGIRVINRGFDVQKGQWSEAEGKAYFLGDADVGRLKVSFFGPFYGAYNIVHLDHEDYRYAMVTGPDMDYLWILAREPYLKPAILDRLLTEADSLGFSVDELIFPVHIADEVTGIYRGHPPDSINSLHADRAARRPMEIDLRNGVIVELGKRHGIATPCNEMAVALLKIR